MIIFINSLFKPCVQKIKINSLYYLFLSYLNKPVNVHVKGDMYGPQRN